ncbi:MAG: hypothetical protein IPJ30_23820 [Acidobacteria bacterium]|nr:hypothetical protein [Acidobacteriota bacterium]
MASRFTRDHPAPPRTSRNSRTRFLINGGVYFVPALYRSRRAAAGMGTREDDPSGLYPAARDAHIAGGARIDHAFQSAELLEAMHADWDNSWLELRDWRRSLPRTTPCSISVRFAQIPFVRSKVTETTALGMRTSPVTRSAVEIDRELAASLAGRQTVRTADVPRTRRHG